MVSVPDAMGRECRIGGRKRNNIFPGEKIAKADGCDMAYFFRIAKLTSMREKEFITALDTVSIGE